MPRLSRCTALILLTVLLGVVAASPAAAVQSSAFPWEDVLGRLADSFKGPVGGALIVIGICIGCFYLLLTDSQKGFVQIVKGIIAGGIISGLAALLSAFGISTALV